MAAILICGSTRPSRLRRQDGGVSCTIETRRSRGLIIMNLFRRLSAVAAAACLVTPSAWACIEPATVCHESAQGSFALVSAGQPAAVLVDSDADPAVRRVAA